MPQVFAGSSFTSTASWTVKGQLTDPTNVSVKYQLVEGGSIVTLNYPTDTAIVKVGVGVYQVTIATTQDGIATVQWKGTGAADAQQVQTIPILELPL